MEDFSLSHMDGLASQSVFDGCMLHDVVDTRVPMPQFLFPVPILP